MEPVGRHGVATGTGVALEWVELEGPLGDEWPPPPRKALFGDLKAEPFYASPLAKDLNRPARRTPLPPSTFMASKDPVADARRLLREFLPRAFRRPVTDAEVDIYLRLARGKLEQKATLEEALRTAYRAVLCSPDFLFLRSEPGKPDAYVLASRLSYFLWSTLPDAELTRLAADGSLLKPAVLRAQTERLLEDPRSRRFVENFTGQWLRLRHINETEPDALYYPEKEFAKDVLCYVVDSMAEETRLYFTAMVKEDLSVTHVIDSDFAFVNEPLAKLYGLPDVHGAALRRVKLPPDSHRGGIMTQASVLKVTADGNTTSPVKRGTWLVTQLLGRPLPPPPPNVAALEPPDVRGATTIRQRLEKHRSNAACASCHARMDPYGFALENFDVIGGWRDNYRTLKEYNKFDAPWTRVIKGPPVDAAGEMTDGRHFKNVDELKKILLTDKDQLARNLASQLMVYGIGSRLTASNRLEIDEIVARLRGKNHGVRTMIHEVVQSKAFREE